MSVQAVCRQIVLVELVKELNIMEEKC